MLILCPASEMPVTVYSVPSESEKDLLVRILKFSRKIPLFGRSLR